MSDDLEKANELSIQESRDRIQINALGVRLLYGIALTAFFACGIALILNDYKNRGLGNGGALAGLSVAALILYFLYRGQVRRALALILWGFALVPIVFGLRTFGFGAPGIVFVPLSIMAASWALSIRHAVAMTVSVIVACFVFFVLIRTQQIVPVEPDVSVRVVILIGVIIVALLLGLVGVRALRSEFEHVRQLANSLQGKAEELKRSEASFSSLFLANPLPAISGDMQGHMIDVNNAFVTAFGFDPSQLIGKSVQEIGLFAHEEERRLVAKFTLRQGVVGYPVTMRLSNGEKRHYLISTSAFELSGGWRFVALFLDQTDRLAAEKAQHILTVELEQRVAKRTAELSDALQNLRRTQSDLVQAEKLASLGSMVAGIAHELNTPVGNALMVASTLLDQEKQFEAGLVNGLSRNTLNQFLFNIRDSGDILDRNLRRTADLINSFKQIAVDQTSEQRRDFDLQEVAHEVLVTLSPSLRKTKHILRNEIPQGIKLNSFPGPLEQVIMNMVNNSLRHAFDEEDFGIMRMSAELSSPDEVKISFSDNGKGIPAQHIQRIFDPFFTTKLGQGGSGLGLSIAYNIVTVMLGGRLEVHSELGQGTEFIIEIPLTAPVEQRSV
ncbi:PAS domain-containing sensor histidine kinase [Undibacterium sp. LX40W]|uniref:histidine kinase n=1 Tax=Undibacterium nitidum TaxID=2762298 RepID=A0A923HUS3_9BURK|nr:MULTISPECIES: PAS domain-containing sensor histidine kinase [Undibacterium]MBC3880481.1 PAS domain-containing sensor histidine kinase [Undibacterium nitidum]MBC3890783.1 PAS domain-containing sensor histidine kinase [Undibacterium sp. LX40W]